MTGRLLTARTVADLLGVSTETVLRWTRRGELPAIRLPGGALRYREDELEAWLDGRATSVRGGVEHPLQTSPGSRATLADVQHPHKQGALEMPAIQRGQPYKLGPGRWGLRYYDARRRAPPQASPFPSKSAALAHYRDVIEPQLRGEPARAARADARASSSTSTSSATRANVRPRTIATLRDGSAAPSASDATGAFGDVPLRDLERMSDEIAAWQAQPAAARAARDRAGAPPDARRGRALGLHELEPGEARRAQPAAAAAAGPRVHARRARRDRAPSCRRRTRRCRCSPPRPGCGPRSGRRSSAATSTAAPASLTVRRTVSERRGRRARQDQRAAAGRCRSRARALAALDALPAAARHAAAVPGARGRAAEPRQLPPPRVGARDRGVRRRDARRGSTTCARRSPPTRSPPGSTVFELARVMGTRVRDDRAPLRHAARRRRRGHRRAPRCPRSAASRPRRRPPNDRREDV